MTAHQEPTWIGDSVFFFCDTDRVYISPHTTYSGTRFHNLDLRGFNFFKCVFLECEFVGCLLEKTDWSGSKFCDTKFMHCTITDSTFNYSQFAKCLIEGCDLSKSRLAYSQFSETTIVNSCLERTRIIVIDFCDSQIEGCTIDGAGIMKLCMVNTPITGLTAETKVMIVDSRFNGLTMKRVELESSHFHNSRFENVTFQLCNFWKSKFVRAMFIECTAHHSGFNQTKFFESAFCGTKVVACRLRYVEFDSVIFEQGLFAFNVMDGANFEVTVFDDMELHGNWLGDHNPTLWPKPCVPLPSQNTSMALINRTSIDFAYWVRNAQIQGFDIGTPISVAFRELALGRKQSHWIWYVFPQVAGLGSSPMSTNFAVHRCEDLDELLDDPLILANLTRAFGLAVQALANSSTPHLRDIFGHDELKVVSSATLFAGYLDRHPRADTDELHSAAMALKEVADYDGLSCSKTQQFLENC